MAVGNFIFFLLTALVAVNLIFAESEQPSQQDAVAQGDSDQEANGRFFFNRFASCNFTATPGSVCLGCNTASRCLPNNVAIVRPCRGLLSYCNGGRCSFIPAANCTGSG